MNSTSPRLNKKGNPNYLYLGRLNTRWNELKENMRYNSQLYDFDIMKCYGGPIFIHNHGYSDVEVLSVEECCTKLSLIYLDLLK